MNSNKQPNGTPTLHNNEDGLTTADTQSKSLKRTTQGSTRVYGLQSGNGSKKPKQKSCKVCKTLFTPNKPLQCVCSVECATTLASDKRRHQERNKALADRKLTREKLEKLKTRTQWASEAQKEVNRYVRLRDVHLGCVSCDKPANWDGQWHASHFRSVGAASAVRFNLWNIHKSCSVCNNWKSGNIGAYRPRLIEKIGLERVEWLENHPRSRDYDVEYLQRLIKVFNKKINRMNKRRICEKAAY